MRTTRSAAALRAYLLHINGRYITRWVKPHPKAHELGHSGHDWVVRLPADLRGANALSIFVYYAVSAETPGSPVSPAVFWHRLR